MCTLTCTSNTYIYNNYHRKPTKRSRVDPPTKGQASTSKATCIVTSSSLTDKVSKSDYETTPNVSFYGKNCPKLLAAKLQPIKPFQTNGDVNLIKLVQS